MECADRTLRILVPLCVLVYFRRTAGGLKDD